MSATPNPSPARWFGLQLQEGGLLAVIFVIGLLLTLFAGTVRVHRFQINAHGEPQAVVVERNGFLNAQNLAQLAKDTSINAIMAVGATFVIIAGGIDLSVAAIFALAAVLGAMVFNHFGPEGSASNTAPWFGVLLGTITCIGVSVICGWLNGTMIVALRVHPFIITLGTMSIFRGIAFVITNGQSIGGYPKLLRDLIRWEVGDGLYPAPPAIMLLVTIAGGIYLSRLAAGRRIYAIGGNELASGYSGINVNRVKLSVYVFSGLTAGIAAVISLGYYGGATSGDGQGYELNVIAAAVVGGASLAGGRGSALGALLGAVIIQLISAGIVTLGINQNYSQIIIGAVVVIAVVLNQFNGWLAKRRLLSQ